MVIIIEQWKTTFDKVSCHFYKIDRFFKVYKVLRSINDNPSLTIVKDDPWLTIVYIFINNIFFQKRFFFYKTIVWKNDADRFYKSDCLNHYSLSKVQNGWVVFNNVNFFRKRNDRFLKQSKNETKKRLTTHNVVTNSDEF